MSEHHLYEVVIRFNTGPVGARVRDMIRVRVEARNMPHALDLAKRNLPVKAVIRGKAGIFREPPAQRVNQQQPKE